MTAPFVTEIRTTDDVIRVGGSDGAVMHLRVQVAELWDTVRVDAAGMSSVAEVKNAALAAFFPAGVNSDEFVTKLRGFEILNENDTLEASGVRDGSTILLARRRRRPVK
jgi:heptaprenylglyceryl phosphate synthase